MISNRYKLFSIHDSEQFKYSITDPELVPGLMNKAPQKWYVSLFPRKVAVVPGAEFGADPFERLSYATSMEDIEEGLNRIEEVLKKLS